LVERRREVKGVNGSQEGVEIPVIERRAKVKGEEEASERGKGDGMGEKDEEKDGEARG